MKKLLLTLTTIILAGFLLIGCNPEALEEGGEAATEGPQVIKIGSMGPLAGDYAWLGEGILNGITMGLEAESDENYTFEVVAEDSQCDPKQAVNAYNKVKSEGAVALAGPECSAAFLAVAPLAERDKIVAMSPSATNPDIADAGDFIFRAPASDSFSGKMAAEFMYNDLGFRKVGVNAKNDAWGQALAGVFEENFTALGGEVTAIEKHEPNTSDVKTQLTKIKNSGAEAIYVPTFPPEFVVTVKQMGELGMGDWTVIGGDASNNEEVSKPLAEAANKMIVISAKENSDAIGKKFVADYVAKYEKDPSAYAAEGYDTARLLAQAIKAVGTDSEAIRDYLYAVEGYKGASGTMTFDERGESVEKEFALFEFVNGEIVDYVK